MESGCPRADDAGPVVPGEQPVPAVVAGTRQLLAALPELTHNLARYLKPLGIPVNQADI